MATGATQAAMTLKPHGNHTGGHMDNSLTTARAGTLKTARADALKTAQVATSKIARATTLRTARAATLKTAQAAAAAFTTEFQAFCLEGVFDDVLADCQADWLVGWRLGGGRVAQTKVTHMYDDLPVMRWAGFEGVVLHVLTPRDIFQQHPGEFRLF